MRGNLWTRVQSPLAGIPVAAWLCALVALLSAVCWSLLTPPFQVVDEPDHFSYVQQLAERHRLPVSQFETIYSAEEQAALVDLNYLGLRRKTVSRTISTEGEQRQLESDLGKRLARRGSGGAGLATAEPPLYYLLQTIPYELGRHSSVLERLELMRLLSALMAAFTALFAFMFTRELLPGAYWAWVVGGLGVALAPALGYISGGLNPEAMLIAVCSALFFAFARGFRRGFSQRLAVAIGGLIAAGLLTKLNFIGLLPGIALGLGLLGFRVARGSKLLACRRLLTVTVVAALPFGLYIAIRHASRGGGLGIASASLKLGVEHGPLVNGITYIWELYLPRLPGMFNYFPGVSMTRQVWFDFGVGLYGWADTTFPIWVENFALIPVCLLAALAVVALARNLTSVGARVMEIVVYLAMSVGVFGLVGASSYLTYPNVETAFAQPRYLLPLIALWGGVLGLAARGAGPRWGPRVAVLIVVLVFSHDLFSQLLVVARYYG